MQKYFISSFLFPIFLLVFICVFFIPLSYNSGLSFEYNNMNISYSISDNNFMWPTPKYIKITSYFGYRTAPTSGASTFHSGIDIAAPEGSNVYAIYDGIVTFTGFSGAGGYTIIILHSNGYTSSYSHLCNNFFVSDTDTISKGDIIGKVGPKYIDIIENNPYRDSNGKATNGATTGPHLHFSISYNGKKIDPLVIFK